MADTDRLDIQASLAGDEDAYARLVRRYQDTIARQMRHFSRDPRVCEELVQDVFVEVYFGLERFRGDAPFLHWVRRIATRVGYRYWKSRAREKKRVPLEAWTPDPQDDDPGSACQAAEQVHRLFACLGPEDRLVLTLLYLEDCSVREVAERMGWNPGAVKMRACRARKKIRQRMDAEERSWMP